MNRIIVVEDDPVVWLDLSELLAAHFPTERITHLGLAEASAILPELSGDSTALVMSELPPTMEPVVDALARGVRLVLTNSVPPGDVDGLAGVRIIGRPFDGADLLAALD